MRSARRRFAMVQTTPPAGGQLPMTSITPPADTAAMSAAQWHAITVVRPRRPGALVAAYGDHHVLAVSRRASAHPERVDHQIDMPAPVEPWPRAHHADHAAHQHRDVGRLYAGTDRPRAPGAFDQLCDHRNPFAFPALPPRLPTPPPHPALTP